MMATTELHKIPDTILSRAQVFEFRQISAKAIAEQLRRIADAEGIRIEDAALALIARAAEGSMRDAQSALDQVLAFAGSAISTDDVSTVLGLVGRDLLFELIEAVLDEDAPRAFAAADRAVEAGHELRLVLRELSAVVRDLMIASIDPSRVAEGELAEAERDRVLQLGRRFSREDLMRAFDLLARAEVDIRGVAQPRYYFEMTVLRWMHLRKLVPLAELLEQMGGGGGGQQRPPTPARAAASPAAPAKPAAPARPAVQPRPAAQARPVAAPKPPADAAAPPSPAAAPAGNLKDAFLAEIRGSKGFFYNTVVAQAQRIDVAADRVTFSFLPAHRALRDQFEQARAWLEQTAERIAGRKVAVVAVQAEGAAADAAGQAGAPPNPPASGAGGRDLKAEAMASPAVQGLLEVFGNAAEIRDVEEM
jgi:DNA polymerase-3 subunit gamma/tau